MRLSPSTGRHTASRAVGRERKKVGMCVYDEGELRRRREIVCVCVCVHGPREERLAREAQPIRGFSVSVYFFLINYDLRTTQNFPRSQIAARFKDHSLSGFRLRFKILLRCC